jgi:hypothetical protein
MEARIKRILTAGVCAAIVAFAAVAAAGTPAISQESIAGTKLGLSVRTYKKLIGKPSYKAPLNLPLGQTDQLWSRLVFSRLSVYFPPKKTRAAVIATWERRYKTAAGLGPCSRIDDLKLTYGNRLKPAKLATKHGVVYAYTLGKNLLFESLNHSYVEVVALYNGSDPNVRKPGGSLDLAFHVALSTRACRRD